MENIEIEKLRKDLKRLTRIVINMYSQDLGKLLPDDLEIFLIELEHIYNIKNGT